MKEERSRKEEREDYKHPELTQIQGNKLMKYKWDFSRSKVPFVSAITSDDF